MHVIPVLSATLFCYKPSIFYTPVQSLCLSFSIIPWQRHVSVQIRPCNVRALLPVCCPDGEAGWGSQVLCASSSLPAQHVANETVSRPSGRFLHCRLALSQAWSNAGTGCGRHGCCCRRGWLDWTDKSYKSIVMQKRGVTIHSTAEPRKDMPKVHACKSTILLHPKGKNYQQRS